MSEWSVFHADSHNLSKKAVRLKEEEEEERGRDVEAEGERREASNGRYQKCAALLMPL